MVNLGTCSAADFDAFMAARSAGLRRCFDNFGNAPEEVRAEPGTILETLKPVKIMSHNPPSWWTARGAMAKRRQMEARGLPSFKGWLFVTLTLDRDDETGYSDPETGYKDGKEKLRKFIYALRKMGYKIRRYCWKLEFHKPDADGRIYPHWHLLLDCPAFMKKTEADKAWGLGHTHSLRVRTDKNLEQKKFGYVFKYAAKSIENIPDYILDSDKRLRAWQTSPDFYKHSGTRTGSKTKKARASLRPIESVARSVNTQNAASSFFDDETSGEKSEAATGAGSPLSQALAAYRAAKAAQVKTEVKPRLRVKSTLRERQARNERACVVVSENEKGQKRYQVRALTREWSSVALDFAAYSLARPEEFVSERKTRRGNAIGNRAFGVSASAILIPDEQYLFRVPFAFGGESADATPHAVAADANPF